MTQECVLIGNVCDSNAPNTVQGYAADPNTGALTPVPGSPFAAGLGARSLAVDPTGSFLYVANAGSLDVSAYRVNPSTGALTSLPGSPFAPGTTGPLAIAIAPQGDFVYIPRGDGMIWGYRLDPVSGALTPISGSPWGTGELSLALIVDCTSKFVYAANFHSGTVSAFVINPQTGALTTVPGSPFPAGNNPLAVAKACPAQPVITNVSASPDMLWPPNHRLVNVAINYTVTSTIPAACTLSVSSNEPGPGQWVVLDSQNVQLRAERNGKGSGRTYTVSVTCTNAVGSATAATTVIVPHDKGH
jgi:DNA-binding beta-propeller fold protein YncE